MAKRPFVEITVKVYSKLICVIVCDSNLLNINYLVYITLKTNHFQHNSEISSRICSVRYMKPFTVYVVDVIDSVYSLFLPFFYCCHFFVILL